MEYIIASSKIEIGNVLITFYRLNFSNPNEKKEIDISLHCHLYYEIHIATQGTYIFNLSNGKVTLSAGEMIIIPPGEYHHACDRNKGNFESFVLCLSIEKTNGIDDVYSEFKHNLDKNAAKPIKVPPELAVTANDFNTVNKHTLEGLCLEKLNVAQMVSILVNSLGMTSVKDAGNRPASLYDFSKMNFEVALEWLINANNVSIADIAARLNYSEKHMTRLIRKRYGMSLKELQKKRRLETAKNLLLDNGGLTIAEIAKSSGFGTISNFYRNFKESEGCTPYEFRKNAKEKI